MTTHKTQLARIIEILERDGEISRNQCLSIFISRLASRIDDLERLGWRFESEQRGRDDIYNVVATPAPQQLHPGRPHPGVILRARIYHSSLSVAESSAHPNARHRN